MNASVDSIPQPTPVVKHKSSIEYDTGADKGEIVRDLRAILERGGDASELRWYVETLERGDGRAMDVRAEEADTDTPEGILREAKAAGMSVEQYLRENAELFETEDGWNETARRALDMERRGWMRYSVESVGDGTVDNKDVGDYNNTQEENRIGGTEYGREVDNSRIRGRQQVEDPGERTSEGEGSSRVSAAGGTETAFGIHTRGSGRAVHTQDSEGRRLTESSIGDVGYGREVDNGEDWRVSETLPGKQTEMGIRGSGTDQAGVYREGRFQRDGGRGVSYRDSEGRRLTESSIGGVGYGREVDNGRIRGRQQVEDPGERTSDGEGGSRISAATGAETELGVYSRGSGRAVHTQDSKGRGLTPDTYSEQQYYQFGWAREAGAITKNELDDLYSKIQEKGSLKKFRQSANGEAIVEVNDDPHALLGVNNVFVFVKGTRNAPEITRVLRVDMFDEYSVDLFREDIYVRSGYRTLETYADAMGEELIRYYDRHDCADFSEYKNRARAQRSGSDSERNPAADRDGYQRDGAPGKDKTDEITPVKRKYSIETVDSVREEDCKKKQGSRHGPAWLKQPVASVVLLLPLSV